MSIVLYHPDGRCELVNPLNADKEFDGDAAQRRVEELKRQGFTDYAKTMFTREADGKIVSRVFHDPDDVNVLGPEWVNSPADFGIETHPAVKGPDPRIAALANANAVAAEPSSSEPAAPAPKKSKKG